MLEPVAEKPVRKRKRCAMEGCPRGAVQNTDTGEFGRGGVRGGNDTPGGLSLALSLALSLSLSQRVSVCVCVQGTGMICLEVSLSFTLSLSLSL
jgi:hypothetical protein